VKVWLNSLFKVFITIEIVMHNETSRSLFQKFNVYTLKENYMIKCLCLTNLTWWKLIKAFPFPNIIMSIINPSMNYNNHTYTEIWTNVNFLNVFMYQFKTIHSKATNDCEIKIIHHNNKMICHFVIYDGTMKIIIK
jgi:hypothetical protein